MAMVKVQFLWIALAVVLLPAALAGRGHRDRDHDRDHDGDHDWSDYNGWGGHGNCRVCHESELNTCLEGASAYEAPSSCADVQAILEAHATCYADAGCCHRRWRQEHETLAAELQGRADEEGCELPFVECNIHVEYDHEDEDGDESEVDGDDSEFDNGRGDGVIAEGSDTSNPDEVDTITDANGRPVSDAPSEPQISTEGDLLLLAEEMGVEMSDLLTGQCDAEALQACLAVQETGRDNAVPKDCDQLSAMLGELSHCFGTTGCCSLWEGLRDVQVMTWIQHGGAAYCWAYEQDVTCAREATPDVVEHAQECDGDAEYKTADGDCVPCTVCDPDTQFLASACEDGADAECLQCREGDCTAQVAVKLATTLPYQTVEEFDEQEQLAYREGVAMALGVEVEEVKVLALELVARRRSVMVGEPFTAAAHLTCDAKFEIAMAGKHFAYCEGQLWEVPAGGRRSASQGIRVWTEVTLAAEEAAAVAKLTLKQLNDALEAVGGILALSEPEYFWAEDTEGGEDKSVDVDKKTPERDSDEEHKGWYGCNLGSASPEVTVGLIGGVLGLLLCVCCMCRLKPSRSSPMQPIPAASPSATAPPSHKNLVVTDGATTGMLVLAVASKVDGNDSVHGKQEDTQDSKPPSGAVTLAAANAVEAVLAVDDEKQLASDDRQAEAEAIVSPCEALAEAAIAEGVAEEPAEGRSTLADE